MRVYVRVGGGVPLTGQTKDTAVVSRLGDPEPETKVGYTHLSAFGSAGRNC